MNHQNYFHVAMYLRLSRDDSDIGEISPNGSSKAESNSISSQRELIRSYIDEQDDMGLYDVYVDDGFSGSNFDRPEFIRMIGDIEAGKINCVIVKDLSRFGRDYIETGRYLEKIFPSLGVRFIALTDHYDSISADNGDRTIVLPVKNFINDSYCCDISTKVKSQLAVKRRAGECLAPFAAYGYRKAPEDKNHLVVDDYAAEIVRRIFLWKIEGWSVSAIAKKLNTLHVLSPAEYKKSIGLNYKGGFQGTRQASWGSNAIKRILTNEIYLGHMVQGKTEKINYKIKKRVGKPQAEWIKVENTHEPIISWEDFQIVQELLKADGRVSIENGNVSLFTGLLFCADCGEQMVRRLVRYKDTASVYYICSTKNRGEGCSRHSISEPALIEIVSIAMRKYANNFLDQASLFEKARQQETSFEAVLRYNTESCRLKQEQDRYYGLCAGLREDLQKGVVTREEFERLHGEFEKKAEELGRARSEQEKMVKAMLENGAVSAGRLAILKNTLELKEIDRHTLASMVKRIYVHEKKRIEVQFHFADPYQIMLNYNAGSTIQKQDAEGSV